VVTTFGFVGMTTTVKSRAELVVPASVQRQAGIKQGDRVKLFLLARGVECEKLDTERFKVTAQMQEFLDLGGDILACGTCLKLRQTKGSELCPVSTMKDLYEIVRDSDRVITF